MTKKQEEVFSVIQQFLIKQNIQLTYNPATAVLEFHPRHMKTHGHAKTCTEMIRNLVDVKHTVAYPYHGVHQSWKGQNYSSIVPQYPGNLAEYKKASTEG